MQNRYVGDIGDYLKLGILRALSPGHRLGVAWWLHPDEDHNKDGRHIGYLQRPDQWRHYDPSLFDILAGIVASGQRAVRTLEAASILPGATFASEVMPSNRPVAERRKAHQEWFTRAVQKLSDADLVFIDPDNGLQPDGFSHGSAKAGKSVLINELLEFARPGRCLIVYHHQTRRTGGHHTELEYWGDRLRGSGFTTVDALRAKPYSPRVYFLLNAPPDIRQRAEQLEVRWQGRITWHPNARVGGKGAYRVGLANDPLPGSKAPPVVPQDLEKDEPSSPQWRHQMVQGQSTQPGYVNRNGQEVMRPTGIPGTDHGQYVYVLRCQTCGHEYGVNGSDIWLRRCPNHDRGAAGRAF